jgi:hypothetical protein
VHNVYLENNFNHYEHLFHSLAGHWQLKRRIHSAHPDLPSGIFLGSASFDLQHEEMYWYQETGQFKNDAANQTLYSHQHYIYQLQKEPAQISIWSTNQNTNQRDGLLHHLNSIIFKKSPLPSSHQLILQGTPHLCKNDCYQVHYIFNFKETVLTHWTSIYEVAGLKKKYCIHNNYCRP